MHESKLKNWALSESVWKWNPDTPEEGWIDGLRQLGKVIGSNCFFSPGETDFPQLPELICASEKPDADEYTILIRTSPKHEQEIRRYFAPSFQAITPDAPSGTQRAQDYFGDH